MMGIERLLDGYRRFQRHVFPQRKEHFHLLSDRQAPDVLFLTCADSRVVPDLILQTEPGDLFICRNVGNIVPPKGEIAGGVTATIEYAVKVLRVKHIIICGHSDCGAIKASLNRESLATLPHAGVWLRYLESAQNYLDPKERDADAELLALIHANVIAQLENLKTHPEVSSALSDHSLEVHGWFYDILTGTIEAYDPAEGKFRPLNV
jgi:carbonic anhydrase